MIYHVKGTVKTYSNWILCYIDEEIARYYRSLIPKYYNVKPPRELAHISIVRPFEWPDRPFSQFDGDKVDIQYYLPIRRDATYFWLDCMSDDIRNIRRKLGLQDYLKNDCFHITLGNLK